MGLAVAVWLGFKQLGLVRPAAARIFLQQGARVIDVRTSGEFQSGHLATAINFPLDQLADRVSRAIPNKETVLLLHCGAGVRSGMGKRLLQKMGYSRVFNLGSYGRAQRILRESSK